MAPDISSNTASTVLGVHGINNLRKFFSRFPRRKSLSLSTDSDKYGGDISKCPMMSSSLSTNSYVIESPTQQHINLVRTSWERVSEIRHPGDDRNVSPSHAFGLDFYEALFEMDEDAKLLFDNVFQQARALTGMIAYIARAPGVTKAQAVLCPNRRPDSPPTTPTTIRDINAKKKLTNNSEDLEEETDPEWLAGQMRELGVRHYFYNVKPHHFELVGPAFVTALKKRLGEEYTNEMGEAWVKANSYAAYNMKIGYESQQAWEEGSNLKRNKAACTIQ